MGLEHLVSEWKDAFNRADVVVFPDYSLPMLHSELDNGNFFVISGSPVHVLEVEKFTRTHQKNKIRTEYGFREEDLIVLVLGSSLFYNNLPLDCAVAMRAISPLLMKPSRTTSQEGSVTFVFLCGNSTEGKHGIFQENASHFGILGERIRHYGLDADVNSILMISDVVLYGSFQDEQEFPPLLIRAMTFGIPVIAPDTNVIEKYLEDKVHVLIFHRNSPETLTEAFSLLVASGQLFTYSHLLASSARSHARNLLAAEYVSHYAEILENIIEFSSDSFLPEPIAELFQHPIEWDWDFLMKELKSFITDGKNFDKIGHRPSVVTFLENKWNSVHEANVSGSEISLDIPLKVDWEGLLDIDSIEETDLLETEELQERMERVPGSWDVIHNIVRKLENSNFERHERDEGDLERFGQSLCIYEIYWGQGAWRFLHGGPLYCGLGLSSQSLRSMSDDVDATSRLPLLNSSYYKNLLCEIGGMFSVANHVDNLHRMPWIGFHSWRAGGSKFSLSPIAEKKLEEATLADPGGDLVFYWVRMDLGYRASDNRQSDYEFWSMCDSLNGGHCRYKFEQAFQHMYGLRRDMPALPPMPSDGDYWSSMHSWIMPTTSFIEFIAFSRMFASSLDSLHWRDDSWECSLGSTELEKKHCYCSMLELLVNVWAYHSARRMMYINPSTGIIKEQHPLETREGVMWVKYFNSTLLKSMDEDLAEEADDGDHPDDHWLWPLTGEVYCEVVRQREKEESYRKKMDKKRKNKEKIQDRQKYGYKQKPLGG